MGACGSRRSARHGVVRSEDDPFRLTPERERTSDRLSAGSAGPQITGSVAAWTSTRLGRPRNGVAGDDDGRAGLRGLARGDAAGRARGDRGPDAVPALLGAVPRGPGRASPRSASSCSRSLLAFFAPWIVQAARASAERAVPERRSIPASGRPPGPSRSFLFGVDTVGRDVFSRVLYGARVSLEVALVATALSVGLGVVARA